MNDVSPTPLWPDPSFFELNTAHLHALYENAIPAIRVEEFVSLDECRRLAEAIRASDKFQCYLDPPIPKVGISQFEYSARGKRAYFRAAALARRHYDAFCAAAGFDPLNRLIGHLAACAPTQLASEDEGVYFAPVVRNINRSALLHMDFGRFDGPGWAIGGVDAQLGFNIYLTAPAAGGDCVVYNRPWAPGDEVFKIAASYGYDKRLVQDRQVLRFTPRAGDLVLFNSRNFHEVEAAEGERITISGFVGRLPDRQIIWA